MSLSPFYDENNPSSIIEYATALINNSLRRACPPESIYGQYKGKGSFGQFLEKCYFGITPNSRSEPDFFNAGIELKSLPLRLLSKGKITAKERMVLSIINYNSIVNEDFYNSLLWKKSKRMLIVFYLYAKELHSLDQQIKDVRDFNMETSELAEDLKIIRNDWLLIKSKIENGFAHELSESDTLYLGACTKGSTSAKSYRSQPNSGILAKQRAFSLKQSYMATYISKNHVALHRYSKKEESIISTIQDIGDSFDVRLYVESKFKTYFGYSTGDLQRILGTNYSVISKAFLAQLTRGILGFKSNVPIKEFKKAGITVRTLKLEKSGILKEAISFPAFKYCDIVEMEWEDSDLFKTFVNPFFFIVFEKTDTETRLSNAFFWSMPESNLNQVRGTWLETRKRIIEGNSDSLPAASETSVVHVRPHARNSADTIPLPTGGELVRKSFWLNRKYIFERILVNKTQ